MRKPFPEWVDYRPNQIWIYDTTHFPRAKSCLTVVEDLVSRKWIADILSSEETSTQVQIVFTDALYAEGLLELSAERAADRRRVDPDRRRRDAADPPGGVGQRAADELGLDREFMAMCAIAQHFGRPGTPTDQSWIESFNGHLKVEYPHLLAITDPVVLRAELDVIRERWNGVRLHAGIGYVTPNDEHEGRGPPSARLGRPASKRRASDASPTIEPSTSSTPTGGLTMSFDRRNRTRDAQLRWEPRKSKRVVPTTRAMRYSASTNSPTSVHKPNAPIKPGGIHQPTHA